MRTGELHSCCQGQAPKQFTAQFSLFPNQIRSDQLLSRVRLFVIPWIAACQASLSITNSRSSPRLTSIESVMPSSHLILCCPLLLQAPRVRSQWDGVCPWLTGAKRGDSHSTFLFHLGICHGEMMVNVFAQTGTWLCFTCWVPPLPYTMPVLTPPESLGLQGDPTSPFWRRSALGFLWKE